MFMSYDGGATPACVDAIQQSGDWSQVELGLLGSLDKVGLTLTSVLWGRVLQEFPTKVVLSMSLFVNASSVLIFGTSGIKVCMFLAKLLMGITQGCQAVWGTCWVLLNAPDESITIWLGFGAVSAGLGNGIGTAVAGFATAQGMPYAFAYEVESCALFILFSALLFAPRNYMGITSSADVLEDDDTNENEVSEELPCRLQSERYKSRIVKILSNTSIIDDPQSALKHTISSTIGRSIRAQSFAWPLVEGVGDERFSTVSVRRLPCSTISSGSCGLLEDSTLSVSMFQQILKITKCPLYLWTALAISATMFVISGIQFLWIRFFIGVWNLDKGQVVVSFLVVTGAGGLVGVLAGPLLIDKCGGFTSSEGRRSTLFLTMVGSGVALFGSGVAASAVWVWLVFGAEHGHLTTMLGYSTLGLTWFGCFLIFAALNGFLAGLTGINVSSVEPHLRSLASGFTVTLQNCLGTAMGPLLPGFMMDFLCMVNRWDPDNPNDNSWILGGGLSFVLLGMLAVFACTCRAWHLAKITPSQLSAQLLDDIRHF